MKKLTLLSLMAGSALTLAAQIPVNYGADQAYKHASRRLSGVAVSSASNGKQRVAADVEHVYTDATATQIYAKPGEALTVAFNYAGDWMNGYVYIDLNGDNALTATINADGTPAEGSEIMSYSFYSGNDASDGSGYNSTGASLTQGARNVLNPPAFTLPADLAYGTYTIRFKVDWNSLDPAGDMVAANGDFIGNGGAIVDATLLVTDEPAPKPARLHFENTCGFFVGDGAETGVPAEVPTTDLALKMVGPQTTNYAYPEEVRVEVKDKDGNTVKENFFPLKSGKVTIPAEAMQGGQVYIYGDMVPADEMGTKDYQLVWFDEFTGKDGSQPRSTKWKRADHDNNSAWNRYISTSNKVVYVEDGDLVTRCIPCAEEDRESNKDILTGNYRDWMSGAVDTKGIYSFKYGRIDVRSLTNPFTGSFPAIWLLPDDQSAGWPYYGEIDIWEMVNTQNKAHGTVHAQRESQKTGNTDCNYDGLYHVFTLEWDDKGFKWSVDGKAPYSTYLKSSLSADQIANKWWPFDKKFYIILNQSVGMGGWAANPVAGHEYETRFDFVRVYQTPTQNKTVGIDNLPAVNGAGVQQAYDLAGRKVSASAKGMVIAGGKCVLR